MTDKTKPGETKPDKTETGKTRIGKLGLDGAMITRVMARLRRLDFIQRLWIGGGVLLLATLIAEAFVTRHGAFGIDGTFGFYAWYGLLTCAAMVFGAKLLGIFLKRRDDYYDD